MYNQTENRILFVNYYVKNCGVYQYGKNLFEAISTSKIYQFDYIDVSNIEDIDKAAAKNDYQFILYNYHPQTLSFISPQLVRRYKAINIAIMHEMTQVESDSLTSGFFQYYVMGDPTLIENNPIVFKTGRFITPYANTKKSPDILTVGTFGFANGVKGYQRLVDTVQREFDEAVIKIHIPSNGIIDNNGIEAKRQIQICQQKLYKSGIRIESSHEMLDRNSMLDFLAGNTINAFLYDYIPQAGISSSTDHAIAVNRPIAITKSIMFRHLTDLYPSINIEDNSLKKIIENGNEPFLHLSKLWSEENIVKEYEEIFKRICSNQVASNFVGTKLNRILDNQARKQYQQVINKLFSLVPEMMSKKIPEANIQQAFVIDTVERFIPQFSQPRILCVGSYEDTACAGLKKLGYTLHEIDPVVNNLDLNTFVNLPTTIKEGYDIILSTSVLEHIEDDETFVKQIVQLLSPGGIAILTCDYNDLYKIGDPIIQGDYRFYTQKDLILRILPLLENCSLVDIPHWYCPKPDFYLAGFQYSFASLVFQKNKTEKESSIVNNIRIFNSDTAKELNSIDWSILSVTEQANFFSKNGFLVIPQALSHNELSEIRNDIKENGLTGTTEDIWIAPSITNLISNDKLIEVLHSILGLDILFFKGAYVEKKPQNRTETKLGREALHVDYGIGEDIGDYRKSCASWINAAYYLTDLSLEHAPFWVVPESNHWYHVTPGTNMEYMSDYAKIVLAKAGDIVIWHSLTVHAAGINISDQNRSAFFFSYRPAWAKPIGQVRKWSESFVEKVDKKTRSLLLVESNYKSSQKSFNLLKQLRHKLKSLLRK